MFIHYLYFHFIICTCELWLLHQASILLRPGKYLMSETIELYEEELEIIGDFDDNEEPSDVTIYCKGISVSTELFLHRVSKKLCQLIFCSLSVKYGLIS